MLVKILSIITILSHVISGQQQSVYGSRLHFRWRNVQPSSSPRQIQVQKEGRGIASVLSHALEISKKGTHLMQTLLKKKLLMHASFYFLIALTFAIAFLHIQTIMRSHGEKLQYLKEFLLAYITYQQNYNLDPGLNKLRLKDIRRVQSIESLLK